MLSLNLLEYGYAYLFTFYHKRVNMRVNIRFMTEDDMQNAFKAFHEGSSQCYAVELFVVHLYLLRCLRAGQDN